MVTPFFGIVGLAIASFIVIVYIVTCWRKKFSPRLEQGIFIVLSCAAGIAAAEFGYIVAISESEQLGVVSEHKVTMILGAFAVIWTSVVTIFSIFFNIMNPPFAESRPILQDSESFNPPE